MKRYLTILLLTVALTASAQNQKVDEAQVYVDLDDYIEQVAETWKLKGIVVMIGDDKNVLHKKCIGYRDPEATDKIPMDEHTVFQIASVSKSFTTALIASLVDEGRIKWDDKVIDLLPDFEMSDPWVTKNATIKDFCCHRTGLKDFNGSSGARLGYSKSEMMHLMKYIKPEFTFRDSYHYCNMAFVIPALVVEKVTGKSWQQNIRERLYEPLGMSESLFRGETYVKAFADRRASWPYQLSAKGGEVLVTRYSMEDITPGLYAASEAAGGIISTPLDMTRWAQFHMRRGTDATGIKVISRKQMDFMHTPANIIQCDESSLWGYGMAWITEQWSHCKIVHHTGTNTGQISICAYLPEFNRTFTINSNTELPTSARRAILYRYIDLLLDRETRDYNAEAFAQWKKENAARAVPKKASSKNEASPDYRLLAGTFVNNADWGDITVSNRDGKLYLKLEKTGREWELTHVNGADFTFNASSSIYGVRFNFVKKSRRATSVEFTRRFLPEFGVWTRKQL